MSGAGSTTTSATAAGTGAGTGAFRLLPLIGAAIAALILLLDQSRSLVPALYTNSDTTSAPVITALMGGAGSHGLITLGNYAWYESMWGMLATRWLPGYRYVWMIAPFIFSGLGLLASAWATKRTFGLRAAAVFLAATVCVSYGMREILFTPDWHGAVVFHTCLLDAMLVLLALRWTSLTTGCQVTLACVCALITAAGATDLLLVISGIIPFVLSAGLVAFRTRRRDHTTLAVVAALIGVASVAGGELASYLMRRAGVISSPFTISISLSAAPAKAKLLIEALAYLGGGSFASSTPHAVLATIIILILVGGAALIVLHTAWQFFRRFTRDADTIEVGRQLHQLYWSLVLIFIAAAFIFSTAPSGGVLSARFAAVAYIGVFALLAVHAYQMDWRGSVVLGAVTAFAIVAVYGIAVTEVSPYGSGPNRRLATEVMRYAQHERAAVGYAEYRDAAVITWFTHLKTHVYPVMTCTTGSGLCPFYLHTISGWYHGQAAQRSYLITDSGPTENEVTTPPPAFGSPVASKTFGGYLTVWVYSDGIGAKI